MDENGKYLRKEGGLYLTRYVVQHPFPGVYTAREDPGDQHLNDGI